MQGVGFEPTPPKRILPESTALDHSAILATKKERKKKKTRKRKQEKEKKEKGIKRQWQDLNLRTQRVIDFKSIALTTRPHCHNKGRNKTKNSRRKRNKKKKRKEEKGICIGWGSNPRVLRQSFLRRPP